MNTTESNFPMQPAIDTTEATPASFTIEGITEPAVLRYFETMNVGDFEATSSLFATDGVMRPPFESEIEGPEAIAAYLHQEAQSMKLEPSQGTIETRDEQIEVQVTGKVQTSWCGVNVAWLFILNQQHEITFIRIKLLASPQELINLRR